MFQILTIAFIFFVLNNDLKLVASTNCTTNPEIVGDIPAGACIVVNTEFKTKIIAKSNCKYENISEIEIKGPTGTWSSDLEVISGNQQEWYKNLSWVPQAPGQFLVCATASDTSLLLSNISCFTLVVGAPDPQVNQTSISPVAQVLSYSSNSETYTFSCAFTVNVSRPSTSAYIRIFSKTSNSQVLSIDSASTISTTFIPSNRMTFNVPIGALGQGSYYILFDKGVAVFDDYCKPLSLPLNDAKLWTFTVEQITTTTLSTTMTTTTKSISLDDSKKYGVVLNQSNQTTTKFIPTRVPEPDYKEECKIASLTLLLFITNFPLIGLHSVIFYGFIILLRKKVYPS